MEMEVNKCWPMVIGINKKENTRIENIGSVVR